ncbi:hypothetical protein K438DRAFT_1193669 [Mycena galopus ATCC 62051]|nr:hypothetical protein K438DRAFT_1193669 [Mycena galopus ATCC 62051]
MPRPSPPLRTALPDPRQTLRPPYRYLAPYMDIVSLSQEMHGHSSAQSCSATHCPSRKPLSFPSTPPIPAIPLCTVPPPPNPSFSSTYFGKLKPLQFMSMPPQMSSHVTGLESAPANWNACTPAHFELLLCTSSACTLRTSPVLQTASSSPPTTNACTPTPNPRRPLRPPARSLLKHTTSSNARPSTSNECLAL